MYLDLIKDKMKDHPGRLQHILGVSEECVKLAKHYKLDEDKAYTMGLLHDIAKKLPLEEQKEILIKGNYEIPHHKIWHSYAGEYICKMELGITDKEILDGVKYHTTCCKEMTPLMKVLFMADIIEQRTRSGETIEKMRKLAYTDLDVAIAYKLNWMLKKIKTNTPHKDTVEAFNNYRKYLERS
ncbi:bis(5'-nucleosyl)-tetraphosphatase (symmetrical) YqeK [Mycoplasmatota bacterium WC44]